MVLENVRPGAGCRLGPWFPKKDKVLPTFYSETSLRIKRWQDFVFFREPWPEPAAGAGADILEHHSSSSGHPAAHHLTATSVGVSALPGGLKISGPEALES